jgi:hypothetical protein
MNQRITRLALATALIACTSLAQAQWMWVNDKGVKQLSDQPPPPGTPPNRILKAPRGAAAIEMRKDVAATPANGDEATPAEDKTPAQKTTAERNAEYNKRQKEAADKTAKAQEEAKRETEKKKYCAEAKNNMGMLESGMRVAEMGANGERNLMTDETRAQKIKEQRESINSNCK